MGTSCDPLRLVPRVASSKPLRRNYAKPQRVPIDEPLRVEAPYRAVRRCPRRRTELWDFCTETGPPAATATRRLRSVSISISSQVLWTRITYDRESRSYAARKHAGPAD